MLLQIADVHGATYSVSVRMPERFKNVDSLNGKRIWFNLGETIKSSLFYILAQEKSIYKKKHWPFTAFLPEVTAVTTVICCYLDVG